TINGTEILLGASAADATGADQAQRVADAINNAGVAGVTASVDGAQVVLTSAEDIIIGGTGATASTGLSTGTTNATEVAGTTQNGFENEDVLTAENADRMILAMDAALDSINSSRAQLGAVQNRFESVVANLQTT